MIINGGNYRISIENEKQEDYHFYIVLLDRNGRLLGENDIIFWGNSSSSNKSVTYSHCGMVPECGTHCAGIDFDLLPDYVYRIEIIGTTQSYDNLRFDQMGKHIIRVRLVDSIFDYSLPCKEVDDESGMIEYSDSINQDFTLIVFSVINRIENTWNTWEITFPMIGIGCDFGNFIDRLLDIQQYNFENNLEIASEEEKNWLLRNHKSKLSIHNGINGFIQASITFVDAGAYRSLCNFAPYGYFCMCLTKENIIVSENYVVFLHNSSSSNGEIERIEIDPYLDLYKIDLDRMSEEVDKIIFCVNDDIAIDSRLNVLLEFIYRGQLFSYVINNADIRNSSLAATKPYYLNGTKIDLCTIAEIDRIGEDWRIIVDGVLNG